MLMVKGRGVHGGLTGGGEGRLEDAHGGRGGEERPGVADILEALTVLRTDSQGRDLTGY